MYACMCVCVYVGTGCPGRKRARPRASVTLFSNFPFMGYRLVSICRFVTTPGDLHGQIGLLHAATYPAPLSLLLLTAFYITIFRHRARDLPPLDISLRDNLFCLFLCVFFFFSLFLSVSLSLYSSAGLSWKIMLGRALCISNTREPDELGDRSRIASVAS